MALRLTGSPTTAQSATPPDPSAAAAACLDRHDLGGYGALFAEAASIADVHARYAARVKLVEAALRAGQAADRARVPAIYLAAARATIVLLEEEPREPVLLNYAGVLLYELWSLDAAAALFAAARRLDPELANVQRNLDEVVRRRKGGAAPAFPRATAIALTELAKRARRAADRARPAEGLRLSLCMIVKDEEEMLPRCLAAAAPAVDEIVIVDTGSSDRTIEIAREFGATVIERAWTGSFSDARNVSFDAATGDWLMFLDADEVLVEEDVERLRALRGKTWRETFYLSEISYTGELGDGTAATHTALRVFRARPEYRFSGSLHEQIAETLPLHLPERIEATDIRIEHFGYLGAVRDAKEKSRRNIELLLKQRDEGQSNPFLHYNLGSEHGAVGDSHAALAEFERAWELIVNDPQGRTWGFMPALVSRLVRALRICGRHEDCIARGAEGLARYPGFTDIVFEQASATLALGDADGALRLYRTCVEMGDAPSRYTATVGMGTFLPTIAIAEIHHARGETAEAVALLDACLAEFPGFFGLVLPFAAALLADGAAPDAVVARVEACVAQLTPTVRFMLGTALYEQGETEAAEAQYRLLLEAQPGSGAARVALAEALLSQRRWDDAAAEAAALADDDPHAHAARRSELFARLVAGDAAAAGATLARAAAGGMPSGELALFAAWCDLVTSPEGGGLRSPEGETPVTGGLRSPEGETPVGGCLRSPEGETLLPALPLEALAPLATTLEALLRVQEVDAFGALVPLLDRSPLAPRERRELLAGMYLRRGFLASAAEEWLAICQADPRDVRGLVGLAQVAAAQGMTDDAIELAREARALEPGERRATRLLARLAPLAA
ncbi:MAG TPA: glycosyltransferase [Conexibacter sp.]|jgi:glycosyltransferase involved in cell wall biosynthesis/predicted Zn-dependent protease|nr:glycosyltransferase [Conexibacter sp.]